MEEGERRHHIMANHGDIQPVPSTCLWQLYNNDNVTRLMQHRHGGGPVYCSIEDTLCHLISVIEKVAYFPLLFIVNCY